MLHFCAVVDENLSVMSAKPVLSYFAEKIPSIPETASKSVCEFALLRIQGRIVSFEEQVCSLTLWFYCTEIIFTVHMHVHVHVHVFTCAM